MTRKIIPGRDRITVKTLSEEQAEKLELEKVEEPLSWGVECSNLSKRVVLFDTNKAISIKEGVYIVHERDVIGRVEEVEDVNFNEKE